MQKIDAIPIKRMAFADSAIDGSAIAFGFEGHDGNEYKFACPPTAIPIVVGYLLAAAQHSAMIRKAPELGIAVRRSRVTAEMEPGFVSLTLYPTEQTGIPFALDHGLAQKLSADLAQAASTVHPTPEKNRH